MAILNYKLLIGKEITVLLNALIWQSLLVIFVTFVN